MYKKLQSS